MIQNRAIVTVKRQKEIVCHLSTGAMSLNDHYPRFKGHAIISKLNISEMVQDTDIVKNYNVIRTGTYTRPIQRRNF